MTRTFFTAEPGKQETTLTHIFDAPPAEVFKVYIDPQMIPLFWGPARLTTVVDKLEPRPGGQWRFVQRDDQGHEYAFHGVFHSVQAAARLVFTFEYEGMPGHVLLETLTFEGYAGRTRLMDVSVFQSVEDRDAMVHDGMESGALETMERLAGVLVRVR